MGYIPIITAVIMLIVVLYLKSYYDEKDLLKKYHIKNNREWGKIPAVDYSRGRLKSIQEYYEDHKMDYDVDDITWNDVDMESIFMLMNNTQTNMGEDYLYAMLHQLKIDEEELLEREKLITFLKEHDYERNLLQTRFRLMGKIKEFSLYRHINMVDQVPPHSPVASILMSLTLVTSIVLIVLSFFTTIDPLFGVGLFVVSIINNVINYFRRKDKVKVYFLVYLHIIRTLDNAKALTEAGVPQLDSYFDRIRDIVASFKDFKRGSFMVFMDGKQGQGSFLDVTLDYIRILFHIDLIKFDSMTKKVQSRIGELNELYDLLGQLDAMIAVASFRCYLENEASGYCLPQLHKKEAVRISVVGGYHPLLEEPVTNSMLAQRCVLITGSNASGKSTFIKTMAICAILAQTIHTVPARAYDGAYFRVMSSMALRDDLQSNESYYIVEIKSLKRILEGASPEIPLLCFVDEVLRGTNTLERIAASAQILNSLAEANAICFAATHDLELTHILEQKYDNYHFQEEVVDQEVIFDYVLRQGRSNSRNAIKLLGMMGYEHKIIAQAEQMAKEFLTNGVWNNIE